MSLPTEEVKITGALNSNLDFAKGAVLLDFKLVFGSQ